MDHEYNVVGGYIPAFVQHLKDTGARLGLRLGSRVAEDEDEDETSTGGTVEEPAEGHGLDRWTPAEQDAFFRAVSVHSRWRPDLIAACVPTKTEWEVWMYMEALEEGVTTLRVRRGGADVDVDMEDGCGDARREVDVHVDGPSSRSWSHSGSDEDEDEDMDLCEPALEVSQAWIDAEERMASWIVHEEHLASDESGAIADTPEDVVEEPPTRKRGRPRGTGRSGGAPSGVRGQSASNDGGRSPSAESTSMSAHKRAALMSRLELPHLLVLDSILREGEEAMHDKGKGREGSITGAAQAEHGGEGVPPVRDTEAPRSSHQITAVQGTPNVSSNMVIDPVLLALSGDGPGESACTAANVPTQGSSSLHDPSSEPASLEASGNAFTFTLGNATLSPTVNAESDLSVFSPRSRRRIQKRLYMRRKRAEKGSGSNVAVHTGVEKLKPGKKAKSGQSEASAVLCSEAPSDAEVEPSANVPKKNKPGLRLEHKLKAQFAELGIDAAYLRGEGMGLLNLGALGRLMGLCPSLERGEEEAAGSAVAPSIDARLIQHLQTALVAFVTDIMHRAIVWRERETRLKQRSRVWRQGDQIPPGAVDHAVEAVGARYHSHKEYFRSREAFYRPANAPEGPSPADATVDPGVDAADLPAEPPCVSPHRDVYAPLVHPPSAWGMRPLVCLTRAYGREAEAETETETETAASTDEEGLAEELRAEAAVDGRDTEAGARAEVALWQAIR